MLNSILSSLLRSSFIRYTDFLKWSSVYTSVLRIMATDELREVPENNPDPYMQADTNKNEIKVQC